MPPKSSLRPSNQADNYLFTMTTLQLLGVFKIKSTVVKETSLQTLSPSRPLNGHMITCSWNLSSPRSHNLLSFILRTYVCFSEQLPQCGGPNIQAYLRVKLSLWFILNRYQSFQINKQRHIKRQGQFQSIHTLKRAFVFSLSFRWFII